MRYDPDRANRQRYTKHVAMADLTDDCGCGKKKAQQQAQSITPHVAHAMNTAYWDQRWGAGTGLGDGSRGRLAEFKLTTVQNMVDRLNVKSVVDVGCGDGSQLASLKVSGYRGLDISERAIEIASKHTEANRLYSVMDEDAIGAEEIADMSISLDVIIHLDTDALCSHLDLLFHLSRRYVLIYSANHTGDGLALASHMHFTEFVSCIEERYGLTPIEHVLNAYPAVFRKGRIQPGTSFCDFYLYDKKPKKSTKPKDEDD